MKPTLIGLGILLLPSVGQDLTIRHVPKTIDSGFSTRTRLCPGAPYEGGVSQRNDARRTLEQLLGPITAIDVHQFSPRNRFSPNFKDVERYLGELLALRPRTAERFAAWAEMTPLDFDGILGTLRFANGSTGAFEVAGVHVCAQDSSGVYWWFRLVPGDTWPTQR
jgi:hypothetical protein